MGVMPGAFCCPHCHGTGTLERLPAGEDEVAAAAEGLRHACRAAGKSVFGDDRVDEATAAWMIGREPGTLRNWRAQHRPIPFRKLAGRVSYWIPDIARWLQSVDA